MLQRTTSSTWLRGVVFGFSMNGLDGNALLREAGIEPFALDDDSARVPTHAISRLWALAVDQSGDQALGVKAASVLFPAQYGVVGYTMMSSPSLRVGVERLIRYLRLVSDAAEIRLEDVPGGGRVVLRLMDGLHPVPRQRVEYAIVMLLSLCRWVVGGDLIPAAASFTYPPPTDRAAYDTVLCCPIQFDSTNESFTIPAGCLDAPLPTAVPALAAMHERLAHNGLDRLDGPDIGVRVQDAIQKRLRDAAPLRAQIAADLKLSDRTLQRRLAAAGTTFDALVNKTRRELAEQYLTEQRSSPLQIAFLLGYADQRSFFRACSRWFGKTPKQWRDSNRTRK